MLGYIEFIGILFLNGIALGEVLDAWHEDDSLTVRIGTAIGLGLAFNVILALLFFAFEVPLLSIRNIVVGIIFSVIALSLSVHRKRRFDFFKKPEWKDLAFLGVCVLPIAVILGAYFAKSPYFPDFLSVDFVQHVRLSEGLHQAFPSLSTMAAYFGVHFQMADLLWLEGDAASTGPFTVRYGMAILALLSPYLVYLCVMRLSNNLWVSFITTALYSLGGLWFFVAFNAGLYANFYGFLASLFLLSASIGFLGRRGHGISDLVLLCLAFVNAYFSHYTTFLLFPALLVYGLAHLGDKEKRLKVGVMSSLIVAPAVALTLFFPELIAMLAGFRATTAFGVSSPPTWLAWIFYDLPTKANMAVPPGLPSFSIPFPALGYLIAEVSNDWASFLLILLIVPYVYAFRNSENKKLLLIPLAWFLTVMAASPFNGAAWRFSVVALLPLTLIAGAGLFSIIPFDFQRKGHRHYMVKHDSYLPTFRGLVMVGAVVWLMVFPLPVLNTQFLGSATRNVAIGGSWGYQVLIGSAAFTGNFSRQQQSTVEAIQWLDRQDGRFAAVSVAYQPFIYSQLIGKGRTIFYAPDERIQWPNPQQVALFSLARDVEFVIVTRISPLDAPSTNITTLHNQNLTALKEQFFKTYQNISNRMTAGTLISWPVVDNATGFYLTLGVRFDPWTTFSCDALSAFSNCLVYENSDVKIYCLTSECKPKS